MWNYTEEKFAKRTLKLERVNADPQYLRKKLREEFPELSAGDRDGTLYKFWRVRMNHTELLPLPVDVDNVQALLTYGELGRSRVYIKADVSVR